MTIRPQHLPDPPTPYVRLSWEFIEFIPITGIFDSHITPDVAKEKMSAWIDDVTNSELVCFNDFVKTLSKYQEQITNYFIQRHNSGFVEGFNNRVKVLKRRCYGLSNATKLFQRLVLDTVGLSRFAPGVAFC